MKNRIQRTCTLQSKNEDKILKNDDMKETLLSKDSESIQIVQENDNGRVSSINKNKTLLGNEKDQEQSLNEEKDQEHLNVESSVENNPQENKEKFIQLFKEQIYIVESFFNSELAAQSEQYSRLRNKMDDKKSSIIGSFSLPLGQTRAKESYRVNFQKENAERDELGYAVSWKRAFSQLYNITSWLHSYCTINFIACQKILKKMKKVMKEQAIEGADEEMNEFLKSMNFVVKLKNVIELRKNIKVFYADELTSGNQDRAEKELMERMKGNRSKDRTLIAFHLGMIISNLFAIFILWLLNSKKFN
jgi:hypothetical protein